MPELSLPRLLTIAGCLLIIGLFAWSLASVWRRLRRDVLRPIDALRRRLPRRDQLAGHWERYGQEVEKHDGLRPIWQRYRSTILNDGDQLRSLLPASMCISNDQLALRLNPHLHGAMPHLLTGIGILFTFLGLIIGISGAKSSVTAAEQVGRTAALETLLGGAHLAFWTSALGLLLSLVLSAAFKVLWRRADNACSSWAGDLDTLIVPLTASEVAYRQLEALRTSTQQLERFNTDLAISIAQALDEQQARWLQPTLKTLIEAAHAMRENQVNFDERLTGELLGKFEAALTGSAQSKMELVAHAMGTAAQQLSASSTTIADQQARWTEEMRAVAANLREGVEATTTATQQRVGQLLQTVDQTLAGVHARLQAGAAGAVAAIQESGATVSSQLQAAASELRSVVTEVQNATTTVTEAAKAFAASKKALAQLALGLNAAGDDIRHAAAQLTTTMQGAAGLQQELLATARTIKHEHTQLANLLAAFEKRFAEVDRSAQGLFTEINTGLDAFSDKVREFLVAVDKHLAEASATLGRAIMDLTDVIEERFDAKPKEP